MADVVAELEVASGLEPSPARSLVERVGAVEIKIMGASQTGSLKGRIEALAEAARHMGSKQAAEAAPSEPAPLYNMAPARFVRIEPPNQSRQVGGDYFADVMKATKGKVFRFKTMPIPVYISPYQERGFTEACIGGFEDWEERTGHSVRFIQVDNPDEARIRVIWSHLGIKSDGKGCALGAHTTLKWKSRPSGSLAVMNMGLVPVPLYVPKVGPKYVVPPQVIEVNLSLILSRDHEVRFHLLKNIVAHELGHALGLLGHSPNPTDLMYSLTDEHSRLSPRDIATVRRVYEQKVDVPL